MIVAHHVGEQLLPLLAGAAGLVFPLLLVARARAGALRDRLRRLRNST